MLKDFLKKDGAEGKDKKKQIENIVVFIIILIITVLIINNMWSEEDEKSENKVVDNSKVLASTTDSSQQDNLEEKLEDILESINGVGKVKVLIKYSESSTVVAMYNETVSESTTKENDSNGGSKDIKETENRKEIVYTDEDGANKPITEKIVMPVIEGAIITAQGAGNANVKASIVSAVEAVTGVAVHKIQVFEMNSK
jgi:stage III sporulation protein AG